MNTPSCEMPVPVSENNNMNEKNRSAMLSVFIKTKTH
jgi:hypothetical protein